MLTITTLLLVAIRCIIVLAAPTAPLDAKALLQNGQEAQKQNVAFQTMKVTDPCTDGDKACLSGGVAVCRNSTWDVAQGSCSKTQACFALPSVRGAGTLVTCTSEKNALSAIQATGTIGGIFGNSTTTAGDQVGSNQPSPSSSGNSTDNTCDDGGDGNTGGTETGVGGGSGIPTSTSSPTPNRSKPSSSPKPTGSSSIKFKSTSLHSTMRDPGTVTVTVTLSNQPTTLAPVTRTLSPEEASSVLSSFIANGATVIEFPSSTTVVITSSSGVPTVTSIPTAAPAPSSSGSSPTTVLTAAPSASNTVPAAAQSANSSSGLAGYGY